MSDMSQTMKVKLVDIGKNPSKHMGKLISGSSLMGTIAVLAWLGINPLDFIVQNSSAYKIQQIDIEQLQMENRILLTEIQHTKHIFESQNFVLGVMLESDMITTTEYRAMVHAVYHRRDSL